MPEKDYLVEPLNGGLVTSRDPSLLGKGELAQCDNGCYVAYSQSVHLAPSRANWVTGLSGAVTGLAYCPFDTVSVPCNVTSGNVTVVADGADTFANVVAGARVISSSFPLGTTVLSLSNVTTAVLSAPATTTGPAVIQFGINPVVVAEMATSRVSIPANATTGTAASLETDIVGGESLSSVHYENRHVLMNGKHPNRVLKPDGTLRAHGLTPVSAACAVTTGVGTWVLASGVGYYAYWTTEYDKANDVESDYDATLARPAVVNVTVGNKVTVTRPAQVNSSATHWRLYRSTKLTATDLAAAIKEAATIFPSAFRVGEAEISQLTIVDAGTLSSLGPFSPTSAVGSSWTAGSNATSSNLVYATATGIGEKVLELGNFNITTSSLSAPISGITITVKGLRASLGGLLVAPYSKQFVASANPYLQKLTAEALPKAARKAVPLTTVDTTITLGGSTDPWYGSKEVSWNVNDFTNANFVVRLYFVGIGAGDNVSVDHVSVTVHYGSGEQGETVPFPALTIRPFGQTISVGRNGKPPVASQGCIFQNSLVLDDASDESIIRYSAPDAIDAFPGVNFINFEEGGDRVVVKFTVGQVMVVGLNGRCERVTYLPREVDAEFDRGRCKETIEHSNGVAGRKAACLFTLPGAGTQMAHVNRSGAYRTDGYSVLPLTNDLRWEQHVDLDNLSRSVLVNNPERHELLFFYAPRGSVTPTILTKCLRFHYHQTHLKGGENMLLKVSGPSDVTVVSAAGGLLRSGQYVLYTGHGTAGTIHLENQSNVTAATIKTRQMYQSGFGNEWKYDDLYIHHTLYGNSTASPCDLQSYLKIAKVGTAERTSSTKAVSLLAFPSTGEAYPVDNKHSKVTHSQAGEGISTVVTNTSCAVPMSFDFLVIEGMGMKKETSR